MKTTSLERSLLKVYRQAVRQDNWIVAGSIRLFVGEAV